MAPDVPPFAKSSLLYDAYDILALNKPPGMPSQATAAPELGHALASLARLLAQLHTPRRRLVLAHRLDKETSGVLLVAASSARAAHLAGEFRARRVKKVYWAICRGITGHDDFVEEAPLTRIHPTTGMVTVSRATGRAARTRVRVLHRDHELRLTLVACYPETGRSHQLRVHLALNGLPIAGDKRYLASGAEPLAPKLAELAAKHHMLHAASITFRPTPSLPAVTVEAAPPPGFAAFLAELGWTGQLG